MSQLLTDQEEKTFAEIAAEVRAAAEHLVTEDGKPVDNLFSEKQMRLLTEPLYSSWAGPVSETGEQRQFLAAANVGLFRSLRQPPIVPDVLLSLDVELSEQWEKYQRSYFMWEFGKPPDVVIEIVSNREGHEDESKLSDYARLGVGYYVIHDPLQQLSREVLRVFELHGKQYAPYPGRYLPAVGLGLTLWEGTFERQSSALWLRWCDEQGQLILTGAERAAREAERATQEAERAARLAAKLRELGVDPEQV